MSLPQILDTLAELRRHPWLEVTRADIGKPMNAATRKSLDAALRRMTAALPGLELPDPIRSFYAAANGVHIEWSLRPGLRDDPDVLAATSDLGGPDGVRGGLRLLPLMTQAAGLVTPVLRRRLDIPGGVPLDRLHEVYRFGDETTTLVDFFQRLLPFDVYEDASVCFVARHSGGVFDVLRPLGWDWTRSRILDFTAYLDAMCGARFLAGARERLFTGDGLAAPHPLFARTAAAPARTAPRTGYAHIKAALEELRRHPWILVERAEFGRPLSATEEKKVAKARGKQALPVPDEITALWREHNGCAIAWRIRPELVDRPDVWRAVREWDNDNLGDIFGALEIPDYGRVFAWSDHQQQLVLDGRTADPFTYHEESTTYLEFGRRLRPFDLFGLESPALEGGVTAFVERHDRGEWGVIQLQDHCADWDTSRMTDLDTYLRLVCQTRFIGAARRRFLGNPGDEGAGHRRPILAYPDLDLDGWTPDLFAAP